MAVNFSGWNCLIFNRATSHQAGVGLPGTRLLVFVSSGFFYAARVYEPRWALPCLIAAIGLGVLFSVSQTIRGVHFFSHGIWTGLIIWAINIVLAAGLLPATTRAPEQPITEIRG